MRGENLPIIFGLKLRRLREERGYGLKELSGRVGLSPSYLNEIEKGKKYPKADKILHLAQALEVPYDDLVSLKLDQGLGPLEDLLDSPIVQALPLRLFGLEPRDIVELIARAPHEVSALIRALVEIAHSYDMEVEHFFYAMLRSYQETRDNHFEEIETAVKARTARHGWQPPIDLATLRGALEAEYGLRIDLEALARYPELAGFRSVWVQGPPERLVLNPRLSERQQAFQIGREIGYRDMGLTARGVASSRAQVESFDQVLNDFKASYYAGALMIDQESLLAALRRFFARRRWNAGAFTAMMEHYGVTPEMFLYRLTQLIPMGFGLRRLHFIRVYQQPPAGSFRINKQLNLGGPAMPIGISQDEHYCRRWLGVTLLQRLAAEQAQGGAAPPVVGVQRAHFLSQDTTYFLISMARPLALTPGTNTSVTLGFALDDEFKRVVGCWDDPAIEEVEANETCERCPLTAGECHERAAPPVLQDRRDAQLRRRECLDALLSESGGA